MSSCNSSTARNGRQAISDINASHMEAFKDAIMAYAVYYQSWRFYRHRIASIICLAASG